MDVNDNACILNKRAALESIASNRASTGCSYKYKKKRPGQGQAVNNCKTCYFKTANAAS